MSNIKWKDSYFIGIDVIDKQHRHLVEFAAEIEKMFINGEEVDLEFLKQGIFNYAKIHFKEEIEIARKLNLKGADEHERLHEKILNEAHETLKDIQNALGLALFLNKWIVCHIENDDKALFYDVLC